MHQHGQHLCQYPSLLRRDHSQEEPPEIANNASFQAKWRSLRFIYEEILANHQSAKEDMKYVEQSLSKFNSLIEALHLIF